MSEEIKRMSNVAIVDLIECLEKELGVKIDVSLFDKVKGKMTKTLQVEFKKRFEIKDQSESAAVTERPKCSFITKEKTSCKRSADKDSDMCFQHRPDRTPTKPKKKVKVPDAPKKTKPAETGQEEEGVFF